MVTTLKHVFSRMTPKNFIKNGSLALALSLTAMGHHQVALADTSTLPQTVPQVDVERYLGRWYEIARLPQLFQSFCTKVTADYALLDNGRISVENRCRLGDPNIGFPVTIKGEAYPVDDTNSRLKVEFFGGATVGDYWIFELDENYRWALVGDPDRNSLFVLSREPTLDEALVEQLLFLAETKHGYDVSKVIRTRQQ